MYERAERQRDSRRWLIGGLILGIVGAVVVIAKLGGEAHDIGFALLVAGGSVVIRSRVWRQRSLRGVAECSW
jgi:hypothetical protein